MDSVLMRLFGICAGALALGASILVGLAAAAAAVTATAKGAVVGVLGLLAIAIAAVGVAFSANKTGH